MITQSRMFACSLPSFLLALVFLLPDSASAQQSGALQLNIAQLPDTAAHPLFRVELRNTGDHDLTLNLGIMLGNGKNQYADKVHLFLADRHGKRLHLEMMEPAFVAGRVDSMVVPLPKGATFALPVDLTDYSAPDEKVWEIDLAPGQYTLSAEYKGVPVLRGEANLDMPGISLMPFWIGTGASNALTFTLTQELKPAPRGETAAQSIRVR